MIRIERKNGYILLPVVLLISLVATLAFMLNQESAQNMGMVGSLAEIKQSEYVAQAGLHHSLQQLETAGCGPYSDIPDQPFGNHKYSASINPNNAGGVVTTYTVQVSDDAYIMKNSPTQNFASDSQLQTFADLFLTDIRRSLYRFDIASSAVPAGAQIISAVVRIFVVDSNTNASVSVHQITADWTEDTVNWDNINTSHDAATIASIAKGTPAGQYVEMNITSLVQGWVNGSIVNQGVMLKTTSIFDLAEYTSKEHSNTSQRPELIIKVTDGSLSNRADIIATGTLASGVSRTLTRANITLYQSPPTNQVWQPGAASGKDAEIWDQQPNNNYGDATETWVSSASNDTTRSLLHFNMGEIPAGARILEATLSLYRQSGSGADQPVSAHRIMNPWNEDSVTWNSREAGTNWDTAGGDFDNMAVATTPVGPANQRYEWNITPLVQGWVDDSYPNYGVALTAAIAGMPGERFYTSDDSDPTRHPRLTITYSCECGIACVAPQGSGNILLVVGDDVVLDSGDTRKKALFEAWGYSINLINDNADQAAFNATLANNDVAYISETVWGPTLADKLAATDKGVVSEEEDQNSHLGLSSSGANIVNDSMEIIDNSHYITALFPNGVLPIFSAPMEGMLVTGTPAPGLQMLGNFSSTASLALVDDGDTLQGGGMAAGRRVTIPIGSYNKFNWDYLNNNGRLIVQRAIQWGSGSDGSCSDGNFRDEFTTTAFSNSDGSLNWAGDWIEIDASGLGTGTGKAQILSGEIRLQGTPSGDSPSLAREMDLSGHLSATLSLDYRTGSGVDAGEDGAVIEISADGGNNWTVLDDFINTGLSASGSRSYDISSYIATNTQVRFRINALYGGPNEYFYVDNVDIAASCDPPPPSPSPIAHWKLDETSGTTAVDSVGGHNGILISGPTWTAGQVDGGLHFDGANDHITVPHDATLSLTSALTLSAWVNSDNPSGFNMIIVKGDSAGEPENYWLGVEDGQINFGFDNGGYVQFTSVSLNILPGNWYHVAATFDDATDTVRLFLNGVFESFVTTSVPVANSQGILLGDTKNPLEKWSGVLDDVRIYNSALPASEVADLYSAGSGGGGSGASPPPSTSCSGTFRDDFNAQSYSNNDGTLSWATDWDETGEPTSPTDGDISISNDESNYQLRVRDDGQTVMREADLSGATSATLSFDYRRDNLSGTGDYVAVEVSYNGGTNWNELARFTGTATDGAYANTSYSLDAGSLSANTRIRFLTPTSGMGNSNMVWFDNIQILCSP